MKVMQRFHAVSVCAYALATTMLHRLLPPLQLHLFLEWLAPADVYRTRRGIHEDDRVSLSIVDFDHSFLGFFYDPRTSQTMRARTVDDWA